jgi:hypothetical protein
VELPAVRWVAGVQPARWIALCDDHLADQPTATRVVDFEGA